MLSMFAKMQLYYGNWKQLNLSIVLHTFKLKYGRLFHSVVCLIINCFMVFSYDFLKYSMYTLWSDLL